MGLDSGFGSFPAGSGHDFSRRIRFCGRECWISASRGLNVRFHYLIQIIVFKIVNSCFLAFPIENAHNFARRIRFWARNWENPSVEWIFQGKDFKNSIFTKIKILIRYQNSATVVFHNFDISQSWQNQNFLKLIPIWGHKRDRNFSKISSRYGLKFIKIHQNWKFRKIASNRHNFEENS